MPQTKSKPSLASQPLDRAQEVELGTCVGLSWDHWGFDLWAKDLKLFSYRDIFVSPKLGSLPSISNGALPQFDQIWVDKFASPSIEAHQTLMAQEYPRVEPICSMYIYVYIYFFSRSGLFVLIIYVLYLMILIRSHMRPTHTSLSISSCGTFSHTSWIQLKLHTVLECQLSKKLLCPWPEQVANTFTIAGYSRVVLLWG